MSALSRINRQKLVPTLLLIAAAGFLIALELTRSNAEFDRDTFRASTNYSSESAVTVGGDRPADLFLPTTYSKETPVPLLIDLHGYTGESQSHSIYTFLQAAADKRSVAYIAPNGLKDSAGSRFWNGSSACCNFGGSKVSDVDYINSIIEEISSKVSIDQSRIYLFGHSNGQFMSYKFACSTKGVVTAIAGLAGAMDSDPNACNKEPMNILHIHGTSDQTILYDGGNLLGNPYPSAQQSVDQWSAINSCVNPTESQFDLLQSMQGDESSAISYTCKKGAVELWRINGGVHVPILDEGFALRTLDWLLSHRK
jgi:polyhydroxybutyrate depolymerase